MFSTLARAFTRANRRRRWDSPDHWSEQHRGYRSSREREEAERAARRWMLDYTGLR